MSQMSVWDKVLRSRAISRAKPIDYIDALIEDPITFQGDRLFGDDRAVCGGIGRFHEQPVTFLGFMKGHTPEANIEGNFGMASPEGYRKCIRLIDQAVKFNRPILTFIDTPGAYPGIEAEARGQGEAIASLIAKLMTAPVPVIAVVTGEGGSGGALCLSVGDRIFMLEHAVYAILSPEGFSAILWKDKRRAEEAAEMMRITAQDLLELNIIDSVVPEGETQKETFRQVEKMINDALITLSVMTQEERLQARMERYRRQGG